MTLKQFMEKTKWMNPNANLVLFVNEVEMELDRIIEPSDSADKIILRGPATPEEYKAVADKVRSAITSSHLGSQGVEP